MRTSSAPSRRAPRPPRAQRATAPAGTVTPATPVTPGAAEVFGRFAQLDMPLTTTPEERMAQMRAFRDEAASREDFLLLAKGIVHDRCVAKGVCPTTPRGVLQAMLSALPDLVEYTPDKPGKEVIQSVRATLQPSKGTAISPLTGKNKGRGDCKDLSTLYAALVKAVGFDSVFLWFNQPQAPINHVAVYVLLPGEGWQIVETTVPGARVGQDPYSAIREHGFGDRVGRTTAHELCEKCVAPPAATPAATPAPAGAIDDPQDFPLGESVHSDVPGDVPGDVGDYAAGASAGVSAPSGLALSGLFGGGAADATRSRFQGDAGAAASAPQPAWPGFPAGTRLFVVQASEQSTLARYYPPANLIDQMMTVAGAWRNSAMDHWVGPARITRTGGPVFNINTSVAALWAMGPRDEATLRRDLVTLAERVQGSLARIDHSDWGTVTITPYNPTTNGPLEFWSTGTAARTTTRDDPPGVTTSPPDNPRGETTADTHPGSFLPKPPDPLEFLDALKWIVLPVATVGGLWAARPYFDAIFGSKSAKPARSNPGARSRRRPR